MDLEDKKTRESDVCKENIDELKACIGEEGSSLAENSWKARKMAEFRKNKTRDFISYELLLLGYECKCGIFQISLF